MAIKLEIHPTSTSLDMLGPPDQSSAYSLSGHMVLSLASSHSRFERRRAARILLRSLVITFEGQAELVMQEAGYAAARLCTISKELVSKTTVELSNEGDDDDGERRQPCALHVTFDLPVPGWLPASDQYGDGRQGYSGTQYNLYATVKYTHMDEPSFGSSWVSALCTPFSSKIKVVHAERCGITLNRFAFPLLSEASRIPAFYSVTPNAEAQRPEDNPHPIPADVVSKIELLASVPEHISLDDERFPFALSIRASSLSESEAAKLRVSHMSLELEQVDEYSSSASSSYVAQYPLPSPKEQPPNKVLRDAHPIHTLYDIGLLAPPLSSTFDDAHSLLPGVERVDIPFESADHARKCAEGLHTKRWFTIESQVPFTRSPSLSTYRHHHKKVDPLKLEWLGTPRLRATSQGPFFGVRHALRATVALSYGAPADGEPDPPKSFLAFTLPLDFARFRCAARSRSPTPLSTPELSPSSGAQALPTTMLPSQPYDTAELPAYSQLFYSNGDSRHDDSIPLPLYTPPAVLFQTSGDVSEDGYSSSEDSDLLQSPASSSCHTL